MKQSLSHSSPHDGSKAQCCLLSKREEEKEIQLFSIKSGLKSNFQYGLLNSTHIFSQISIDMNVLNPIKIEELVAPLQIKFAKLNLCVQALLKP